MAEYRQPRAVRQAYDLSLQMETNDSSLASLLCPYRVMAKTKKQNPKSKVSVNTATATR